MARPKLNIDETQIRRLAEIQATTEEIAFVVGCSEDTLERRFHHAIAAGRASGKLSIRRAMYQMAMKMEKHSSALLIYLDKKYLGGPPEVQREVEATAAPPLQHDAFQLEQNRLQAIALLREVLLKKDLPEAETAKSAPNSEL